MMYVLNNVVKNKTKLKRNWYLIGLTENKTILWIENKGDNILMWYLRNNMNIMTIINYNIDWNDKFIWLQLNYTKN